MLHVDVDNAGRFAAKLKTKSERMTSKLDTACGDAAEHILDASSPLVPISTPEEAAQRGTVPGGLRDTAHISKHGPANYSLGYGGPDAPYAAYVHEILEYNHKPPTQAKFLEQPYEELKSKLAAGVFDGVKRVVR